ncbi:MAG: class I SAM-dependent methyltransferase [Phycisphaerales bacterium]|nr:class I SAM-dependent methyltransferase [Phycisphaerales bacterium]
MSNPAPHPRPPAKAHEHAAKRDWPAYYDAVEGKPARDTLLKALELFERDGPADASHLAIDLGCGTGRDALELLRRGWSVFATDSSQEAFDRLLPRIPPDHNPRFRHTVDPFERLDLPPARLINASYALPFCDPDAFEALWRKIVAAIPKNGRFAGQLFGERDDWAAIPDRSHHTRSEVDRLFADFTFDSLQEVENREAGATGEIKNWHIFHIVARKRA